MALKTKGTEPTVKEVHNHIERILSTINTRLTDKYIAGQKEHGGRLWEKNVRREMLPELLDHIIYFISLDDQLNELFKALDEFASLNMIEFSERVKNALKPLRDNG